MESALDIIEKMNNEEKAVIADILLEKGKLTENLSGNAMFRECHKTKTYSGCEELIASEIKCFGGNTIVNLLRGGGPTYHEIVCDVAKRLDVAVTSYDTVESIETAILSKIVIKMWVNMTESQKKDFLTAMNIKLKTDSGFKAEGMAAISAAFRYGGFYSYEIAVIVANAVTKFALGRGLSLAANAAITKCLSVVTGPLGIALSTLWTVADVTGPAYRVTIPIVIYIAALRKAYSSNADAGA